MNFAGSCCFLILTGIRRFNQMSDFANIPYIRLIPESECRFPELFFWEGTVNG
jgi:hypothetical protein